MSGHGVVRDAIRDANEHTPQGFQQITALAAATGLTVPSRAEWALIECEAQSVRWRDDGTNPTTTVGHVLNPGDVLEYKGLLSAIRFIETAVGAKLNVSFYS